MRLFLIIVLSTLVASPSLAFETKAKQAIILDYDTKAVLYDKSAFDPMYPASMTKMLTTYILAQDLHEGKVKLEDTFHISENAWQQGNPQLRAGSNMFVELHSDVKLEDLLRGIIIQSGNDACIAVAEGLAGSIDAFSERMNVEAKKIGMNATHFTNPDGWPDPAHVTTAHDLSLLAWHIIHDYPEFYHYYSEPEFTYNNIRQYNRNLLLGRRSNYNVDGLKTGHTEASGYGITVSGTDKSGRRLIVVVNGLSTIKERAEEAASLLTYGFTNFELSKIVTAGQMIETLPVHNGATDTIKIMASEDVTVNLPRTGKDQTRFILRATTPLVAPVKKGDKVAELIVRPLNMPELIVPLVAAETIEEAGLARRALLNIKQLISRDQ
ncbi:MAG: D-alanyl-D-alanine carboxypeptidase [Rickettsiales bacterium]|nr:D-alanyl-D-alanine carboxypeptidase [Rickettsiales bacterium]